MSADVVTNLILQYRYWILIPLSFLEGPMVAFFAGSLASVGVFNIYFLAILFFVRDVGMDGIYYSIGYFGGHSGFAAKMLKKLSITDDHLGTVRELWVKYPMTTMFIGKLAYGIAAGFIVVAGLVKMPLRLFFKYGVLVAIVEYGGFLLAGYFIGISFGGSTERFVQNIQYSIGITAVLFVGFFLVSWYLRKKFLAIDKKIGDTPL